MRIVVDLLYVTGRRGGTETYGAELYQAVHRLAPDIELHAVVNAEARSGAVDWFPGETVRVPLSGNNRLSWAAAEMTVAGPLARRMGADVLHCPANFGPAWGAPPTVTTIHDLLSFRSPHLTGASARAISLMTRAVARTSQEVLTVSHASAADITRFLHIPEPRVHVTPLASRRAGPSETLAELPQVVDPRRPFVLMTGNRLPHKNAEAALRAWAQLPSAGRPQLVITGSGEDDPLRPAVADLGLSSDVRLLGWVSAAELEVLYQKASVYVFPTLFEGFGLPVLEAMQSGCPVIANDIPVLREVGGTAATYVDARNAVALASAVLAHLSLPAREVERIRTAGRLRAEKFSWDRTASSTLDVLTRVAQT